jgi:tRNA dimethylallyltransferase
LSNKKEKLIVIVGPTASGKTGLAIQLAKKLGGEVISADSRQVYRGLDIGTEKISRREMRGVPHHCIDIASPRRAYSVERWRAHAERAIRDITRRGQVPIVAGGTGLYVDSLVYGTEFPRVAPNTTLRAELSSWPIAKLYAHLIALDPERAETIEAENPRRLIRAIEVATALGKVPKIETQKERYDVTWIGLNPTFSVLEERIRTRLKKTLRRGLVAETRKLRGELGLSWKRINELGLEYRVVGEYLRGEVLEKDLEQRLYEGVRRYAKRQLRWLKRNKDIVWHPDTDTVLHHFLIDRG